MKSKRIPVIVAILIGFAMAQTAAAQSPPCPVVWSIGEGVESPESICFDADTGQLFASQIGGGGPHGKDGDGRIAKLTVDGKMVTSKWVTGLNSPKGMRSHGGTLWVSDIDRLVGISIADGKVTHEVNVPGAKFLNDVACGPDGAVYVSDTFGGRIHRYRDGKLTVLAEGADIEHPNGLLIEGDKLIVATWGFGMQEGFKTETPGSLLAVDLKTGKRSAITPEPVGNIDGLEADGHGGYIVTDWMLGKVLRVSKEGKPELLLTRPKGTADFAYLAGKGLLIVPEMLENKLTALDVSKAIQNTE